MTLCGVTHLADVEVVTFRVDDSGIDSCELVAMDHYAKTGGESSMRAVRATPKLT